MKTDSLLYRFFKTAPSIFFQLINRPELQGYKFESVIEDLQQWLQDL
ncbi:MAG: DUF2887 domain-containing protein [Jaaginema sp. PMC 1079.18]|nr:DUF2887 domain-containing protein [Jaaginema sp. PMC 1080.18]MEC4850844.1 DUF2887 domain-containing protein [Jaaginema sp. PMC 1079.18]MEC4867278.1 DUF2887 domain-containing protein [Jaaginema sp. PMC 1078.18]